MSSENVKSVVKDIIKTVQKGGKINMQEIQKKHGYSVKSAKAMKAKQTKTWQKEMKPFLTMLQDEISKIQLEMAGRDITEEKYKDLAEVLDRLNKQVQLATGGETERTKIIVTFDESFKGREIKTEEISGQNSLPTEPTKENTQSNGME